MLVTSSDCEWACATLLLLRYSECLPVFRTPIEERAADGSGAREERKILSQSHVFCVAKKRWLASKCPRSCVRTGSGSDRIKRILQFHLILSLPLGVLTR